MHSGFVFNKIPTILKSEEILDKSLSRAVKIEVPYQKELKDKAIGEIILLKTFPQYIRVNPEQR